MHKGVILIVEAGNREEAIDNAECFLSDYGEGRVWDWYEIGGRWTGQLDGYEPDKDPINYEKCDLCEGTGVREDMEVKDGCNACAGKGVRLKWQFAPHENDVMPLADCIEAVKRYGGHTGAKIKEYEKHEKEAVRKSEKGYYKKCIGELMMEEFCFDADIYNVSSFDYSIPDDLSGFWAVVVDYAQLTERGMISALRAFRDNAPKEYDKLFKYKEFDPVTFLNAWDKLAERKG